MGLAFVCSMPGVAAERFLVEWREPDAAQPWLREVRVRGFDGATVAAKPAVRGAGEYPHRLEATVIGPDNKPAWVQVRLAGGYGFTFSDEMLRVHPYLWVKDLGLYISREGWAETAAQRAAAAERIRRSFDEPFISTAERYYQWSGFTEHEPDDIHRLIWPFIDVKQHWPVEARAMDRIATMPEVDAAYFEARVPDLKYAKMFLGWPDHNDQFTVWSHGRVTVSSQSVGGNPKLEHVPWHPRAGAYSFQFAAGDTPLPRFREYGDEAVHQRLDDGHNLIVTSEWMDGGTRIMQTNFALPLEGDAIRTGLEPLLLWSKVTLRNTRPAARDAWLALEFDDTDFTTFMDPRPLKGIAEMTWRDGAFFLRDRVIAVADPALVFEVLPAHGNRTCFRARAALPAGGTRSFVFAHFYRPEGPAKIAAVRALDYDAARTRMLRFWNELAARGAQIHVPDERLNRLYHTFLPRLTINSHLDPQGMPVLHTGPIQYARVWHHITSYGIGGDLARRGHFDLARRYFEAIFKWQGVPVPDSPAITDWDGFFGAPPEQCPMVWMSYQGTVLWAVSRYYRLSGDRAWLDERLPAVLAGMDWIVRVRRPTRILNPDGTRPLNFGWLPPGRASDSETGSTIYTDAALWLGLDTMAGVLREIGHPRAAELQAEADDYRACITDGERRAAAMRPLLRLNDDKWVPFFPGSLESTGNERGPATKYVNVVDTAWAWGIFDSGVFGVGAPETRWLAHAWEDVYSPMVPGLSDEPFCSGTMNEYLQYDRIANFLYTFYSQSTNTLDRETLTTYEHRSWGQKRAFELTPWAAGYWTMNFTNMLCRTVGRELWLLQATPRRWLSDGESIEVERLQTEFGPITFSVRSKLDSGIVEADVNVPQRQPPEKLRLRLRVPEGRKLRSVSIDGRDWPDYDATGEWIFLPVTATDVRIEARFD